MPEANAPAQQTFNWMNEEIEFSPGVSFDPTVDYLFELADIMPKITPGGLKLVELHWLNRESQVKLKTTVWMGKATISEDGQGQESPVAKLARQLGLQVETGRKVALKEVIRPGMKITARVRKQLEKDGKTESRFSEIVAETIKLAGTGAPTQKTLADSLSSADLATIFTVASMSKDKIEAIQHLGKQGKGDLINPLVEMDANGKLTYKK